MATSVSRLARHIRRHLRRERVSINRLAQLSGLSHTALQNVVAERVVCTLATLDKIAEGMRTTASKLLE